MKSRALSLTIFFLFALLLISVVVYASPSVDLHAQAAQAKKPFVLLTALQIEGGIRYSLAINKDDDSALQDVMITVEIPPEVEVTDSLETNGFTEFLGLYESDTGTQTLAWWADELAPQEYVDSFTFTLNKMPVKPFLAHLTWGGDTPGEVTLSSPVGVARADVPQGQLKLTTALSTEKLVAVENTGVLAHVPPGLDGAQIVVRRLPPEKDPPLGAENELWWCSIIEINGLPTNIGLPIIAPLRSPLPPGAPVTLFSQQPDGKWVQLEQQGVVLFDGQYAAYVHTGGAIATGVKKGLQPKPAKTKPTQKKTGGQKPKPPTKPKNTGAQPKPKPPRPPARPPVSRPPAKPPQAKPKPPSNNARPTGGSGAQKPPSNNVKPTGSGAQKPPSNNVKPTAGGAQKPGKTKVAAPAATKVPPPTLQKPVKPGNNPTALPTINISSGPAPTSNGTPLPTLNTQGIQQINPKDNGQTATPTTSAPSGTTFVIPTQPNPKDNGPTDTPRPNGSIFSTTVASTATANGTPLPTLNIPTEINPTATSAQPTQTGVSLILATPTSSSGGFPIATIIKPILGASAVPSATNATVFPTIGISTAGPTPTSNGTPLATLLIPAQPNPKDNGPTDTPRPNGSIFSTTVASTDTANGTPLPTSNGTPVPTLSIPTQPNPKDNGPTDTPRPNGSIFSTTVASTDTANGTPLPTLNIPTEINPTATSAQPTQTGVSLIIATSTAKITIAPFIATNTCFDNGGVSLAKGNVCTGDDGQVSVRCSPLDIASGQIDSANCIVSVKQEDDQSQICQITGINSEPRCLPVLVPGSFADAILDLLNSPNRSSN